MLIWVLWWLLALFNFDFFLVIFFLNDLSPLLDQGDVGLKPLVYTDFHVLVLLL